MSNDLVDIFDDLSSKSLEIRMRGERAFYSRQAEALNSYLDRIDDGEETLPSGVSYSVLSAQACVLQGLLDIMDIRADDIKLSIR